jgi:CheY-like chemotaxis protein
VVIRVTDTGTGMPPEIKDRIFEPFFTTKPSGCGTGLGLFTVFGMITQSGGHILVESEAGAGTTFELLLPAIEAEQRFAIAKRRTGFRESDAVLVVENDPAVLGYTLDLLARCGCQTTSAATFNEAIEVARSEVQFNILMTDIRLPGGDGWALAKRVAALRPSVRVLYVSGYVDDTPALDQRSASGCEFLKKPYSLSELAEALRKLTMAPVN